MEKEAMEAVLLLFLSAVLVNSNAQEQPFDVRQHLSTVTRYGVVKDISDNSFVPSNIADQCTPIHLNLVARHGTRAPTKKRIKELDNLAIRLEVLLQDAKEQKLDLQKVPAWFWGWKSPWKGKLRGGELISEGEDELYQLAIRIREKFSQLFNEDYHPDIYAIKATQIPRASASAVAFGMGLFSGRGNLGPGHHRAFAVTSESRASDIWLRFHDCCQNYKAFRKSQEPAVQKLKEPILDEITHALVRRYELNFTRQDTSSLWFLCKEEASLLNITDRACASFTPSEVALLEWTDDLGLFILKGYGNALNYRMGAPLLEDVVQSMEQAIKAKDGHCGVCFKTQDEADKKAKNEKIEQLEIDLNLSEKQVDKFRELYLTEQEEKLELDSELKCCKINLENSNKALEDLQEKHKVAISTLKEKEFVISNLFHSENSLIDREKEMRANLQIASEDISALFAKLDQKNKLEAENQGLLLNFGSQLDQSLKDLHKTILGSVSQQQQQLRCMEEHVSSFLASKYDPTITGEIQSPMGVASVEFLDPREPVA